jgi:hypothetical protein
MLDAMPYADLLAIYNAIAEKPVTRFDTRTNGVRRTEALLETRGLTLAEAARLADVVLQDGNEIRGTEHITARDATPVTDVDSNQPEASHEGVPVRDEPAAWIRIEAGIAPSVSAFVRELIKPARPAYLAVFLRRLESGGAVPSTTANREGGMTPSQRKIVELCSRPEGATGKELAEGCGWPSIAARATCQKLADRFGYYLHEKPKADGRGISFRMTAKTSAEEQA